jgi:hypothetical protein
MPLRADVVRREPAGARFNVRSVDLKWSAWCQNGRPADLALVVDQQGAVSVTVNVSVSASNVMFVRPSCACASSFRDIGYSALGLLVRCCTLSVRLSRGRTCTLCLLPVR